MEREVDMNEISDGRRYRASDMARIGCRDCEGCSECCHIMEDTIVLDPYDIWQLESNLHLTMEEMMTEGYMEPAVYNGIILPHLSLSENGCKFLTNAGRCGIHAFRPGYCRLFPLGRVYENGGFSYFHQIGQCPARATTKVRIDKWLGIPNLPEYERYVLAWHDYTKALTEQVKDQPVEVMQRLNMDMLKKFFLAPYEEADFYGQFYRRLNS